MGGWVAGTRPVRLRPRAARSDSRSGPCLLDWRGVTIVANASADKFKALALRHGEKVVMGVTTMLCVLFLYWAVTKETIQLTPDQVKSAASSAQSNIGREQKPEDILAAL